MGRPQMLFDAPAFTGRGGLPSRERTYQTRDGKEKTVEIAGRKKRFGALPLGKLYLARIDICLKPDGMPDIREFGTVSSLGFKVTIAAGQSAGTRWFWDRWVTQSNTLPLEVRRKSDQLRDMMSCYPKPETGCHTAASLSGKVYPIWIDHGTHYKTGETISRLGTLSPDPEHYLHNDYHELVKRFGDQVPGIDLFPDSPSFRLIEKRRKDACIGEDGLSAIDRRRARNCEKAIQRLATR